jgi:hypothetical protein
MRTFSIVFSMFALTACSSSSTGGAQAASAAVSADPTSFCSTYCKRNSACDSSVDVQTCSKTCQNEIGPTVARLRSDVIQGVQSCYDAADCKSVLSDHGVKDCIEESAVSMTPTGAARTFCDDFVAAAKHCDTDINHAECLTGMRLYSDETLTAADACTQKSCSAIAPCLKAEFGE